MGEKDDILIAVDGGGTRTRCALFDRQGRILAEAQTKSANHLVANSTEALAALEKCVGEVLRGAARRRDAVRSLSIGLAGVDIGGEGLAEAQEFVRGLGFAASFVHADIVTAHAGALGGEPGILALAGTGSAFLGVAHDGRYVTSGGWGPAFGDEGSAHWIGQQALRAAAKAYDGRRPATALTAAICEALELRSFPETLQAIYRSPMQVNLIALLSLTTERVAATDEVARQILRIAGEELAHGVLAVARRMGDGSLGWKVSWEGGVLRNSTAVREQFCSAVKKELPGAAVVAPRFDPLYGAFLMGCKSLGWEIEKR
jgi:N-acetylglucosamine kinase-like BadF-type ATPase